MGKSSMVSQWRAWAPDPMPGFESCLHPALATRTASSRAQVWAWGWVSGDSKEADVAGVD